MTLMNWNFISMIQSLLRICLNGTHKSNHLGIFQKVERAVELFNVGVWKLEHFMISFIVISELSPSFPSLQIYITSPNIETRDNFYCTNNLVHWMGILRKEQKIRLDARGLEGF
jgi:hypothetical protein